MSQVDVVGPAATRGKVLLGLMVLWCGAVATAQEGVTLRMRDTPAVGKAAEVSESWEAVSSVRLLPSSGTGSLLASSRRMQFLESRYQETRPAIESTSPTDPSGEVLVLTRRYELATVKDRYGATGLGGPARPLPWAKRTVTIRSASDGVKARVEGPPPLTVVEAAQLSDDISRSMTLRQLAALIGPPQDRAVQLGDSWKWSAAVELTRLLAGSDVIIALPQSPDAVAMEIKLVELPGNSARLEGRLRLSVIRIEGLPLDPPGELTVIVQTQRTADGSDAAMNASVELTLLGRALSESDAKSVVVEFRRELKLRLLREAEK